MFRESKKNSKTNPSLEKALELATSKPVVDMVKRELSKSERKSLADAELASGAKETRLRSKADFLHGVNAEINQEVIYIEDTDPPRKIFFQGLGQTVVKLARVVKDNPQEAKALAANAVVLVKKAGPMVAKVAPMIAKAGSRVSPAVAIGTIVIVAVGGGSLYLYKRNSIA